MSKFKIGQQVCDKKDGEILKILDFSEKTGYYITNWMGAIGTYLEEDLVETENYVEPEIMEKESKMDLIIEKLDFIISKLPKS